MFNGDACVSTPGSALSSTGVWKRVPGAENGSGPECDSRGMYSPRPCPGLAIVGKGVGGRDGGGDDDDERLRSGGGVAGGEDRGDRGVMRPRRGAGGMAGAGNFGDEARKECRRLREPSPSLLCTIITGKDAAPVVPVSCAGSVSAVIAVRRLVLACMGGANGSSLAANTNSFSAPLLEEDGDDGDGGLEGGVAAASGGFCAGDDDPALPRLLGDDGGGDRVGDFTRHAAHEPALPRLFEDDGDGGGQA